MATETDVTDRSATSVTESPEGDGGSRFLSGLGWGIVATIVMSIPMIVGPAAGVLPMPRPIPLAIVGTVLGQALPQPALMALAAGSHLAYGGVAGGILATITRPVTLAKGLGWGVLLWAAMGVAWLPFLGWGLFGTGISPRVTVATLVLHLIYGVTLGWLMDRR